MWRSALVPKMGSPYGRFDRALLFIGAVIAAWLAIVALGRGFGLFHHLF
jgi:hypothetical protein